MQKKMEKLYDTNEGNTDEELLKLLDLIETEDNNDFYITFEKQLSNLINPNENNFFFDFMNQTNSSILDYIFFYINKEGIKISISDKKKKENTQKQIKQEENITNNDIKNTTNSSDIDSGKFFSLNENTYLNNFSNSRESNKEEKKLDSNFEQMQNEPIGEKHINISNINKDKENKTIDLKKVSKEKIITSKIESKKIEKQKYGDNQLSSSKYKNIVIKTDINFDYNEKKQLIKYYGDNSELVGKSFEKDTVNYIFEHLYRISTNKDFSLIYDLSPEMKKINSIYKDDPNFFFVDDIQFDFLILNLKISELLQFMIDIYPNIHPNSKLSLNIKKNNFPSIEDLNSLIKKKEYYEERIDIIGEIGVNILNEEEKCRQILKYAKLIHNINKLIASSDKANELSYILNLLHFNSQNKKLLLFFTDGPYSSFINIKNNDFLYIQKNLNIDSLLVYKNKNSLFRTILLEKLYKKYKKKESNNFNESLNNKFEDLFKKIFKSNNYEKVVKKLSNIEKKIEYIKTDLYEHVIKNIDFIELLNDVFQSFVENEIDDISIDKFEEIKNIHFKELMISKIVPNNNYYIIYDRKNKKSDIKETLINDFKKKI